MAVLKSQKYLPAHKIHNQRPNKSSYNKDIGFPRHPIHSSAIDRLHGQSIWKVKHQQIDRTNNNKGNILRIDKPKTIKDKIKDK